jgi:hypothetical protein
MWTALGLNSVHGGKLVTNHLNNAVALSIAVTTAPETLSLEIESIHLKVMQIMVTLYNTHTYVVIIIPLHLFYLDVNLYYSWSVLLL